MIKSKLSVKISFLFAVLSVFFSTFLFFSCKNFNFSFNSKSKIVVTLPGKMLGGGGVVLQSQIQKIIQLPIFLLGL